MQNITMTMMIRMIMMKILVLLQIETGHIQINSSAGRKRLDCRNIKNTRMSPGNKMATRGKAVHKAC